MTYTYDAWGNPLSVTGSMASTLGAANPLRYWGYVYDSETGLYYLQSRYYDPEICRFINADGYASTGQGLLGGNAFAYCGNCPVVRIDSFGEDWKTVFGIGLVVGLVGVLVIATLPFSGPLLAGAGALAAVTTAANVTAATGFGMMLGAAGSLALQASTGGKGPTELGKEGERQAGIDQKAKKTVEVNGRSRTPDSLTSDTLREVKNSKYVYNSSQLRDYADIAKNGDTLRTLELVVRAGNGTRVASTVISAGWKILRLIK